MKLVKLKLDTKLKTDDNQGVSLAEGGQDVNIGQVAYDTLMYPAPSLQRKLTGREKKQYFKLALAVKAAQPFLELAQHEIDLIVTAAWEKYIPLVAGAFEAGFVEHVPEALAEAEPVCDAKAEEPPQIPGQ